MVQGTIQLNLEFLYMHIESFIVFLARANEFAEKVGYEIPILVLLSNSFNLSSLIESVH